MSTGQQRRGYEPLSQCRICDNRTLIPILDLGTQALTGVFPKQKGLPLTSGPLGLVKCEGAPAEACGLVQLGHTYDCAEMYGASYGYRSGLNRTMVEHLRTKVAGLLDLVSVRRGDVVLDIGSNDGTTLSFYPQMGTTLLGIDPTVAKFAQYYPPHVQTVCDFFSTDTYRRAVGPRQARIVTSIAMFYDLDRPLEFVRQVAEILADDGIWHFEQSYLPLMLAANAYDTVCHEHAEYYALEQIRWMTERAGLKIIDVSTNEINGGSFAITVTKASSAIPATPAVDRMLAEERAAGLHTLAPYERFAAMVARHREELPAMIDALRAAGRTVVGLGASTKGNVILQYCGIGPDRLACVAEVNPEKFGAFTPGTEIPIVAEADARRQRPDVFLVLPWHFRAYFLQREQAFTEAGGKLLFPLPTIELLPA